MSLLKGVVVFLFLFEKSPAAAAGTGTGTSAIEQESSAAAVVDHGDTMLLVHHLYLNSPRITAAAASAAMKTQTTSGTQR